MADPVLQSVTWVATSGTTSSGGTIYANAGDVITITYHFDVPTGLHGGDRIKLGNGDYAIYSTGSNTTAVNFVYTVGSGSSIDTASLTQTDTRVYPGNQTTPYATGYNTASVTSSAPTTTIAVDNIPPTVTAATSTTGVFHTGDIVTFTLTTSEAVVASGPPTLALSNGETATYDAADSTTTSAVFKYTVLRGDTPTADVTVTAVTGLKDAAGNTLTYAGNPNGTSQVMPCFVRGTRIQTSGGEVPVEALRAGDMVRTLSGVNRPIKWIGHRQVNVGLSRERHLTAPIRIRHGSFADGMPHRDLLVSPDHAILVDGMLICARQLLNGTTIWQEPGWDLVHYFHVELESHDILLAEGLAAESYLDTNNRGFFGNGQMPLILHPDLTDKADYPTRESHSCAPFVSDEARVRPVWQRLSDRAASLGPVPSTAGTTDNPGLYLVAAGKAVRPTSTCAKSFTFVLPAGITAVRLTSRAGSPTDTRPWLDDRRTLGVRVERIVLRDATKTRNIPIDHPSLVQGWWPVERQERAIRRWTNGEAILPLPEMSGPNILEIHLSDVLTYLVGTDEIRDAA